METFSFKRIIKISRFPYFWLWIAGFLAWGAMLAVGKDAFWSPVFWILFFWFIFPANVFLNAINDAFDYETDLNNPRKQSLESTVSKNGKKAMLWVGLIALASIIIILPFISPSIRWLILLWIVIVIAYNVPPLRFKQYPITDALFGGVGHYIPIAIIGYVAVSGVPPPFQLVLFGICFCAAGHIFGAALDVPYDLAAGIKNSTVRLGTIQRGLIFSAVLYTASIAYSLYIGLWPLSLLVLVFPVFILFNIVKGNLEARSVLIFKELIWISLAFGLITGNLLYWGY